MEEAVSIANFFNLMGGVVVIMFVVTVVVIFVYEYESLRGERS